MANRSNIMGLHGLKNKPSRNSFDLSHRNLFTAKCGLTPTAYFRKYLDFYSYLDLSRLRSHFENCLASSEYRDWETDRKSVV